MILDDYFFKTFKLNEEDVASVIKLGMASALSDDLLEELSGYPAVVAQSIDWAPFQCSEDTLYAAIGNQLQRDTLTVDEVHPTASGIRVEFSVNLVTHESFVKFRIGMPSATRIQMSYRTKIQTLSELLALGKITSGLEFPLPIRFSSYQSFGYSSARSSYSVYPYDHELSLTCLVTPSPKK